MICSPLDYPADGANFGSEKIIRKSILPSQTKPYSQSTLLRTWKIQMIVLSSCCVQASQLARQLLACSNPHFQDIQKLASTTDEKVMSTLNETSVCATCSLTQCDSSDASEAQRPIVVTQLTICQLMISGVNSGLGEVSGTDSADIKSKTKPSDVDLGRSEG
jgi:hypothetical protein